MARLVVNSSELSNKLINFSLECSSCNSNNVTLDIDWAAYPSSSWLRILLVCDDCKKDEEVFDD